MIFYMTKWKFVMDVKHYMKLFCTYSHCILTITKIYSIWYTTVFQSTWDCNNRTLGLAPPLHTKPNPYSDKQQSTSEALFFYIILRCSFLLLLFNLGYGTKNNAVVFNLWSFVSPLLQSLPKQINNFVNP